MTTAPSELPPPALQILEMAKNDPQLQELMPDPAVERALDRPGLSLQQLIDTVLTGYAGRPAFGERAYDAGVDPATGRRHRVYLPRFDTISYQELRNRITSLATTWRRHEQHRVQPGDFVCILGFGGTDYLTVDLACAYAQAVSVPLQTTLATADLDGIFTDVAPTAVAATVDDLVSAAKLAGAHPSIRSVIAFDYDERVDGDRDQFAAAQTELAQTRSKAELITLRELVGFGDFEAWEPLAPNDEGDERMAMIVHSSGSTGTPKGAIITERSAAATWARVGPLLPNVKVAFAPLNHVMGRSTVFNTLVRGGTCFFTAKSDLSTLFEDLRLVRPTDIVFFPRVLEMIHRHYLSELVRRAIGGGVDVEAVRAEVREEMRTSFLGDRVALMMVGSAPTTPEVRQFIEETFRVPLRDGYSSTESGGTMTSSDRINRTHVLDYKLRDVPELGYYTTDTPYPRGELCVKTRVSTPGYFKRPEATRALYDEDGYLLTGDIMEERGPDHVVYIDRRSDVLKLSQGEYVAVGTITNAFESGSAVIHQMHVYGNSARSYLLAVVVPNLDVASALVGQVVGQGSGEEALRALIRSELKKVAEAENLKSFEVPRDFIVELEPFSRENGLLSSVSKRLRPALQAKYADRFEQMYVELEQKQNDGLIALQDPNSELSVLEKVGQALEAALGVQDIDVDEPLSFVDLGGDSLGAAAFASLLNDVFGVELPVNSILSPAGNPKRWAQAIEAALAQEHSGLPTFEHVHGKGARQLLSSQLDLSAFIDAQTLRAAPIEAPPEVSSSVLLTGATGFLGRFVCLEWLERLSPSGGKVICLVRAADHAAATRRLAAAFAGPDPTLEQRFAELAGDHLEVVVGDVAERRLGLSATDFDRLAGEVDRIVHVGALVNHMLDYEDLFGPNVAGTAELVRLALTTRQKRIDFVSSVATTYLLDRTLGNGEHTPLRSKIALSHHYGNGYGASKWAAEQLLHAAHRRFGLPVNIFRGDMMLANRRYRGQINVPDVFTRLLYSVILTGLAPKSFYKLEADGSRPAAHYDGLPVDFIAGAIVGISADAHGEVRTFHALNHHHDDGLSLDVFVDWIESAGYRVERIEDHTEWLRQFEAKLRALPEDKRHRSSLTVLESLSHPYPAGEEMIDSKRFQDAVTELAVGPDVPHLDREFIQKCLADMRTLDLIAPARFA